MLRRWVALSLVLFTLGFVAACGGEDSGSTSGSGSEGRSTDAANDVDVESDGDAPRRELRFTFAEGSTQKSAMTMKMGLEMTVDGQAFPSNSIPPIRVTMSTKVDKVDGDEATVSFVYDDIAAVAEEGTDPSVLQGMNSAMAGIKGLAGTMVVSSRGVVSDSKIDTSKLTDPAIKSTIDSLASQVSSMTVPFPSDEVGVGAVWKAKRSGVFNGIAVDTAMTYTLKKVDGDSYELDVAQDVSAPPGPAEIPGLGEAKAEIVSYTMKNAGTVGGSLGMPLPTNSTLKGGGDNEMKVSQGTQTSTLKQKITMDVSLTPA